MPLETRPVKIRFKSYQRMRDAISKNQPYLIRHLIVNSIPIYGGNCTRRMLSEILDISINAITKPMDALVSEGVIFQTHKDNCPVTGRRSYILTLNPEHKGYY